MIPVARTLCLAAALSGVALPQAIVTPEQQLRTEAALPNTGSQGYPLPLIAHWNSGQAPGGFSPEYQLTRLLNEGKHLMLSLAMPDPFAPATADNLVYYETSVKQAAALGIPISFDAGSLEDNLYRLPKFFNLPPTLNPNVIQLDGTIAPKLDPMGPVQPWRDVGAQWTSSPIMQQLQAW